MKPARQRPEEVDAAIDAAIKIASTAVEKFRLGGHLEPRTSLNWARAFYWAGAQSGGTYDDDKAAPIVALARKGDIDALDVLSLVVQHKIKTGQPLPPNLGKLVADSFDGKIKRRTRATNRERDWHIALVVNRVLKIDNQSGTPAFKATRNRKHKGVSRPTACSVTADALSRVTKRCYTVELVENAWFKSRKLRRNLFDGNARVTIGLVGLHLVQNRPKH